MLFFENSYIKKYWSSNKVFFLTFIIFYQVLSGKFTHSIHNMAYVAYGSKRSSCRAFFFSKKVNCYILQAYNKLGLPNQRIKYLGKKPLLGRVRTLKICRELVYLGSSIYFLFITIIIAVIIFQFGGV